MTDDLERAIGPDRRTFVKRLVIGSAFAAPVVSSFTMSSVHAVFGDRPGTVTALGNANTVIPPANFPETLICNLFDGSALTIEVDDGDVHITVVVPAGAFDTDTQVCIFKGDLAALASEVPSGHTPLSAYGVAWFPPDDAFLDLPLVMTVTGAPVGVGDPIYMFNKTTGEPEQVGTVAVAGTWVVTFTDDPGFVVTEVGAGPTPSPTPSSPGTEAPPGAAPGGSAPATPVAGQPRVTG